MNRTEQKERLTDMIAMAEDCISGLQNMRSDFDEFSGKYEDLYNSLEAEGLVDALEKDVEEFTGSLLRQMIDSNANLDELEGELDGFKSDLDCYAEEVSESRREAIEERYSDWDDINDKIYSLRNDDDLSIDSASEMLEEIVAMLKQYKK